MLIAVSPEGQAIGAIVGALFQIANLLAVPYFLCQHYLRLKCVACFARVPCRAQSRFRLDRRWISLDLDRHWRAY